MFRKMTPLLLIALLFLPSGCDRPNGASPTGNDPQPMPVLTQSGIEMIYLPGGRFTMGYANGNPDEAPPHDVSLSAFLIDKYPVTHEMFVKVQLPNPSHWQENPRQPVERVRWRDAKRYCNERSLLEGLKPCYNESTPDWRCDFSAGGYRLPTEAEWEYAARAGSSTPWDFDSPEQLRQYAWFADNSDLKTHPVGQKKPNRWGLYDMYGNVSQWCEDVYNPTYYQQSPANDPTGPASAPDVKRVLRGGNFKARADACRATWRQAERTGDTDACFLTDTCGLRCVRRISPEDLAHLQKLARKEP